MSQRLKHSPPLDVRAVVNVTNRPTQSGVPQGGAWTTGAGGRPNQDQSVEVLREVQPVGMHPVRTVVWWHEVPMVVDVMGIQSQTTGLIPDDLVHSLLIICPKCGPNQRGAGGQICVRGADVGVHLHEDLVRPCPECVEKVIPPSPGQDHCTTCFGRKTIALLSVTQTVRCPWLCGWRVEIREGRAYDRKKGFGLFSKIAWWH